MVLSVGCMPLRRQTPLSGASPLSQHSLARFPDERFGDAHYERLIRCRKKLAGLTFSPSTCSRHASFRITRTRHQERLEDEWIDDHSSSIELRAPLRVPACPQPHPTHRQFPCRRVSMTSSIVIIPDVPPNSSRTNANCCFLPKNRSSASSMVLPAEGCGWASLT